MASAVAPVITGTIAPPTMAVQRRPEACGACSSSPSTARLKMVGNMMELNRPTAISDQAARTPPLLAETRARPTAVAANRASHQPGLPMRSRKPPSIRPINAPSQ